MKITQYEITENLQNMKLLGTNDSLTVKIPFEVVKKHVFEDANAIEQKVSKTGDTMTGNLQMGSGSTNNSPSIYWNDKKRQVWAGTANDNGWFYLWDATNGRGIIVSGTDGSGEVFGGNKASLRTDGEGGNLTLQSHDGSIGLEVDSFDDNGFRFYVYQVSPWKYLGDFSIDKNGTLYSSGGFSSFLKDANGAAYKIKAQYSGELSAADWICAWQDLGNNDIRIRAVRQGNLRVYNAARCGDMAPTSGASGSTIMSRDGNGDTSVRYLNCNYLFSSQGAENYNIAYVIYQTGDGYYRSCSLSHLKNTLGVDSKLPLTGGTVSGTVRLKNGLQLWPDSGYGWMDLYINGNTMAGSLFADSYGTCLRTTIGRLGLICLNGHSIDCTHPNGAWAGVSAGAFTTVSSRRYKENIRPMTDERAKKILDVEVDTYDYKDNVVDETPQDRTGVIAEEVVEIMPEVVLYREIDGLGRVPDSVDYSRFVPSLIRMVQIQQDKIDTLEEQLNDLREQLTSMYAVKP